MSSVVYFRLMDRLLFNVWKSLEKLQNLMKIMILDLKLATDCSNNNYCMKQFKIYRNYLDN